MELVIICKVQFDLRVKRRLYRPKLHSPNTV